MERGKLTYAELLRERNKLDSQLREMHAAMEAADRCLIGYNVGRWVSIPLPTRQFDSIEQDVESHCCKQHGDGKKLAGDRWELIAEDVCWLAEYRHYLIRYHADQEIGCHGFRVWGLVCIG